MSSVALIAGNTVYYLHFAAFYFLAAAPFIIANLAVLRGLLLLCVGAIASRFMLGGCLIGHFENGFFALAGVDNVKTDMITKIMNQLGIPVDSDTKFWLPNLALLAIAVLLVYRIAL